MFQQTCVFFFSEDAKRLTKSLLLLKQTDLSVLLDHVAYSRRCLSTSKIEVARGLNSLASITSMFIQITGLMWRVKSSSSFKTYDGDAWMETWNTRIKNYVIARDGASYYSDKDEDENDDQDEEESKAHPVA